MPYSIESANQENEDDIDRVSAPLPTNNADLGETALKAEPVMEQIFIKQPDSISNPDDFERKLFILRK